LSEIAFPIKDLTRRKLQTSLVIVGLTICTAATVFLTIFGENLGCEIAFATGGKLTAGFSNIFSRFIVVVGLLNVVAGAVMISFLVSIMMSERVRDIGVMKATGCLRSTVLSYFLTELSIIIFITFVIISHIFGVRPIVKAIRVRPAEALSPLYSFGTIPELSRYSPSKLGFTFKMAYRSLLRRRLPTQQAIICLAAVLALVSVTIVGGVIANQTTQNYVRRAIGENVVLISHPDVSEQYVKFLSQFFEAKETGSINYLNPNYAISETLVSRLSIIPGVQKADPRLILETTIYEVPGVIIDPERPDDPYTSVGDHRSSSALVLGINPESTISEWLILGRTLNETDLYSALIGDSLAIKSFDSPEVQGFRMLKQKFDIAGVCLDPLDNGDVVYVPFKALSKLVNQTVCNVLLLQIDPSNRSEVLSEIEEICGTNLRVLELEGTLEKHLSSLNLLWSSIMLLPLFSLITATICLISYMMLNITGQQREFGIMRAIGAKPKAIIKMIFTQALIVTLVSGAIGIFAGFLVTFVFLIPDPVISYFTIILIVGWLLIALSCLSLASLYPAVRTVKKSVASTLSQ